MANGLPVRIIEARATWPLRQAVLRPHQHEHEMEWPNDRAADAVHFGAFAGDALVGIASLVPEAAPDGRAALRLRGMAVQPEHRGAGIGAALLAACLDHARAHGRQVWCNARVSVEAFYLRAGFERAHPEPFELAGIGPHVLLALPRPGAGV
jgi:GNAT superfamily N-acetyltransferase